MVLLISYDLNGHERPAAYRKVKNYIERHAQSAIRPLYSQWFVETNASPDAWVNAMKKNSVVDPNDRLFVCPVVPARQGLLTKAHWDWLRART